MTREEAIKDIEKNIIPIVGGKSLRMAVDALRQPDIIHCGECRHFTTKGNIGRVKFGKCSVTKSVCLREDYCSWAERKEGEAE